MDLMNALMLLLFIAIVALVLVGCYMTRSHGKPGGSVGAHH
jgi:VIT1/CCC1 family predicted Fe2+/Mn2+ transporter